MVGENLLDTERVKWGLVLVDGYAAAAAAADDGDDDINNIPLELKLNASLHSVTIILSQPKFDRG
jgi:hypothetical protein